jgi:membrane associated rhomboid family serine protease
MEEKRENAMGLYDRDYYREDENGGFASALSGRSVPVVLCWVMALLFLAQIFTRERFGQGLWLPGPVTQWLGFDSQAISAGQVWRLITGNFLHPTNAILVVVFNLLLLWWAGKELAGIYGEAEFFASFLFVGMASAVAAWVVAVSTGDLVAFTNATAPITAVLVVFALHFPQRQVLLFFVIPVPIWVVVIFIVLKDLVVFAGAPKPAAVVSPLVAVALAVAFYRYQWRTLSLAPRRRPSQPKTDLKLFKEGPSTVRRVAKSNDTKVLSSNNNSSITDEQLEAQLDEVLEKVQTHGQASLTTQERELLLRASEIYRKRRSSSEG